MNRLQKKYKESTPFCTAELGVNPPGAVGYIDYYNRVGGEICWFYRCLALVCGAKSNLKVTKQIYGRPHGTFNERGMRHCVWELSDNAS
jgi:hypothetical protein